MNRLTLKNNGFTHLGIALAVVVVIIIGGIGGYVYHKDHKSKPAAASNNTSSSTGTSQQSNSSTSTTKSPATTAPTNPYAGWKTYCDNTYHYCFMYPASGWTLTTTPAARIGSEGGASLLNTAKTVAVVYSNQYIHDSGPFPFMPTFISKLTSANEALSVVGGYIPSSGDNGIAGNNIPRYEVVNSSYLTTYPLTVGTQSKLPNNSPIFSDMGPGSKGYVGSFLSRPAVTINTVSQSQSWLNSADAKTSLKILQSLSYKG